MKEILRLFGNGGFFSKILDQQEVVWLAIEAKMEKYPEKAEILYNSLMMFADESSHFSDTRIEVWEAHVDELLERIANGATKKELNLGTQAQLLLACMYGSIKFSFNSEGTGFYEYIFRDIFGEDMWRELYAGEGMEDQIIPDPSSRAPWPSAYYEWEAQYKRQLSGVTQDRWAALPTEEELRLKREEDIKRGNKMPWQKYASSDTQLGLL